MVERHWSPSLDGGLTAMAMQPAVLASYAAHALRTPFARSALFVRDARPRAGAAAAAAAAIARGANGAAPVAAAAAIAAAAAAAARPWQRGPTS